jgi:8-oxo-dGTP pyrophosphatase MutT (NUDIX family)
MSKLVKNLALREPSARGRRVAVVAAIVDGRGSPKILLIKRAERAGDPWSGQIAFPGGKMQQGDRTAKEAAMRETLEEVGFDLADTSEFLGYGRVTTTHTGSMDVVPTVFVLKQDVEVRPNGEVASFRWVGLGRLMSRSARTTVPIESGGRVRRVPAYLVEDYVVWGLTRRILDSLLQP